MFTLRAHGVPAHAGLEPEKGANAIVELSRQIDERELGTCVGAAATAPSGTMSEANAIEPEPLTELMPWKQICERYPDHWVALVEMDLDDETDEFTVARVAGHGAVRRTPVQKHDGVSLAHMVDRGGDLFAFGNAIDARHRNRRWYRRLASPCGLAAPGGMGLALCFQ